MAEAYAVETRSLTRTFFRKPPLGKGRKVPFQALDQVTLALEAGELFGLLGPNGAGKTTLIKILGTLLLPTSGDAWVGGVNVVENPSGVREIINMVSGGEHSGYGILTVRENLWLFSQLYGIPKKEAFARIDRLLGEFGLAPEARTLVNRLSSGMRQKMNLIRGFLTDPRVLFLDEPTLGLDVEIARQVRSFIKRWVREKPRRALLLTTHYLAEADELCDRIGIIDRGRVLVCDTPQGLKRMVGGKTAFHVTVSTLAPLDGELGKVAGLENLACTRRPDRGTTEVAFTLREERRIADVLLLLHQRGLSVQSFRKSEPSLEEVFIAVVNRTIEEADEKPGEELEGG